MQDTDNAPPQGREPLPLMQQRERIMRIEQLKKDLQEIKKGKFPSSDGNSEDSEAPEEIRGNLQFEELTRQQREAADQVFLKQKEFEIMARMDMDRLNDMLLNKYHLLKDKANYDKDKKRKITEDSEESRQPIKEIDLDDSKNHRLPPYDRYYEQYMQKRKDIFEKMKETEIRRLYEDQKKLKHKYDVQQYVENTSDGHTEYERLKNQHSDTYMQWLQDQPEVENSRVKMIEKLGRCHELVACINNLPRDKEKKLDVNKPRIWNWKHRMVNDARDSIRIRAWLERKERAMKDEFWYLVEDEELDSSNILREVKQYFKKEFTKVGLEEEWAEEKYEDIEMIDVEASQALQVD